MVGAGTTGVEIASELAVAARSVRMAVRTPPNLIPRILGVLSGLKLILKLPDRIGDAQMRFFRRIFIRDLTAVESFTEENVQLVDGTSLKVDAVIAATGFQPGLENLVRQLAFCGAAARRVVKEITADEHPLAA